LALASPGVGNNKPLNFFKSGRQLQIFERWKTISNFFKIGRPPHLFWKMEDNLNPSQMEDNYFFKNGRVLKNIKNGRVLKNIKNGR
jgi:hypothetical protein